MLTKRHEEDGLNAETAEHAEIQCDRAAGKAGRAEAENASRTRTVSGEE